MPENYFRSLSYYSLSHLCDCSLLLITSTTVFSSLLLADQPTQLDLPRFPATLYTCTQISIYYSALTSIHAGLYELVQPSEAVDALSAVHPPHSVRQDLSERHFGSVLCRISLYCFTQMLSLFGICLKNTFLITFCN